MSALEVSKAVGLVTAKDVNPTLSKMLKNGKVKTDTSATKPLWYI